MIITEDILNFIKETEEEFITNLLEGLIVQLEACFTASMSTPDS